MKYFVISLLILILPFSFISGQEIYSSTLLDQEILNHIPGLIADWIILNF